MEGCYNAQLSRRSSKAVRNRILQNQEKGKIVFRDVFPKVTIKDGSGSVDNWGVTGSDDDNYLATSPSSGSTGIGCDFLILDDTIKNKYEAFHKELLRQLFEDWFQDTLYSRLEGKRKIIIVMTRWATGDMAGRLMQMLDEQGRKYRLISKKAYNSQTNTMLNDSVLNFTQYQNVIKTIGETIVSANYNQEPIDIQGKLYKNFLTYRLEDIRIIQPDGSVTGNIVFKEIRARCDTADTGNDYLAMTIYGVTKENKAYVLDIYYIQDTIEITEKEAARRLIKYNPVVFRVESNNGGRGWSRAVEKEYQNMGGTTTIFKPYTQTQNKDTRIYSNSYLVQTLIYFPEDWNVRFREAYNSMNEYQAQGKNEHDDIEDNITSIAEELDIKTGIRFG